MTRARATGLCILLLVLFGLAEYATLAGTEMAETSFDSGIFLRCAQKSLLDPGFYTAVRPPTVPCFYKLVGGEPNAIRWLQSSLSVIAWFSLACALASFFRSAWLRFAVLVLTCAFSLTSPINQWDGVMMSESLFLSLLASTIAITIFASRQLLHTGRLSLSLGLPWFAISLLFVGSRDSALYLLAIPWFFGLCWFIVSKLKRTDPKPPTNHLARSLIVGFAILFCAHLSLIRSERWHTPLVNVLLGRVLPDPQLHQLWMDRYDLPSNALFEGQSGKYAWNRVPNGIQLRKMLGQDPKLANIEAWLQTAGLRSYQRHLVLDEPVRSITQALASLDASINPKAPVGPGLPAHSYSKGAGITAWSQLLTTALYFPIPAPLWIALATAALAIALAIQRPTARAPAICTIGLLIGVGSQAFITWHGDTAEVARHTLVVGVLMRLALGCALAALADQFLTTRNRKSPGGVPIKSAAAATLGRSHPRESQSSVRLVRRFAVGKLRLVCEPE